MTLPAGERVLAAGGSDPQCIVVRCRVAVNGKMS
jgi:hypothetical protein